MCTFHIVPTLASTSLVLMALYASRLATPPPISKYGTCAGISGTFDQSMGSFLESATVKQRLTTKTFKTLLMMHNSDKLNRTIIYVTLFQGSIQ